MQLIDGIPVWGDPDPESVKQIKRCAAVDVAAGAALMADHHKGYSMPIGGVAAYRDHVSPSGVGYDIACGLKAVRTPLNGQDVRAEISSLMDRIFREVRFGIGSAQDTAQDHELFDDPAWTDQPDLAKLKDLARSQLGTVGSGNHFVDILVDDDDSVWLMCHFGSRGLGHKTATGFLNLATGRGFHDRPKGENMDAPPTLLSLSTQIGQDYWQAMHLAGRYAYAGRDRVIAQVLGILGTEAIETVHNHHNFAWKETHNGEELIVVRKGATPNAPGQRSAVGGSMGDVSVIIDGLNCLENRLAFESTIHGAGRVMSRTQAAGKMNWKTRTRSGGQITREMMLEWLKREGVTLRGAGTDESPHAYKRLPEVLADHWGSVFIAYELRPIGVAMAGEHEFDPYKD